MKALGKIHYEYFYEVKFMNIKYFIAAFATFFSISVAQGAGFLSSQKFTEGISTVFLPKDLFSSEQLSKILSEVVQMELSCTKNSQCMTAVQLIPVSHSGKKRFQKPKKGSGKGKRPNLFARSPMSY
ncbi:hypothetical protein MCU_00910 [Bartonella elizabethae Re6043vi]|uniref:Uncharacterized protein n=3 Tax=Bartonella elizabethae TaxID=807 RepID=J1KG33_BAREL|nr:hypothetical protein MCU_00910 [Bartonella elizabethae Re6043vi]EJF96515.1 hypothetical protein MEE_00414 [Bartonella elizabethae F9251 = ATCC 49927]VEJ39746.1 Uncharacterised protein [Bartonella elizabethae]